MHERLNGAQTEEPIQERCRGLIDRGGLRQRMTAHVSRRDAPIELMDTTGARWRMSRRAINRSKSF
jgi:hypothetical protein